MKLLDNIVTGMVLLGVVAVLYAPVFFILRKRVAAPRQLCYLLLAGSTFVVLFATVLLTAFGAGGDGQRFLNLIPFQWVNESWAMGQDQKIGQVLANAIMFIPIGYLAPAAIARLRSPRSTALSVIAFSISIEVFQYFTGRSADIDDVILNTLGGMLGYALFALSSRLFGHAHWWQTALGESHN